MRERAALPYRAAASSVHPAGRRRRSPRGVNGATAFLRGRRESAPTTAHCAAVVLAPPPRKSFLSLPMPDDSRDASTRVGHAQRVVVSQLPLWTPAFSV